MPVINGMPWDDGGYFGGFGPGTPIVGINTVGLVGTDEDDEIYGHGGNDELQGRGGNDILDGGDGRHPLTHPDRMRVAHRANRRIRPCRRSTGAGSTTT